MGNRFPTDAGNSGASPSPAARTRWLCPIGPSASGCHANDEHTTLWAFSNSCFPSKSSCPRHFTSANNGHGGWCHANECWPKQYQPCRRYITESWESCWQYVHGEQNGIWQCISSTWLPPARWFGWNNPWSVATSDPC